MACNNQRKGGMNACQPDRLQGQVVGGFGVELEKKGTEERVHAASLGFMDGKIALAFQIVFSGTCLQFWHDRKITF